MSKVIAYRVEINGITGVIQSQADLKRAIKATKEEFDNADFGSEAAKRAEAQLAKLQAAQKTIRAQQRRATADVIADNQKQDGSYRQLSAQLAKLRRDYKELSRAEREAGRGDELQKKIQELDSELKELDAGIGQYQRNVGNYRDALADLGGIDLAALASGPAAIAAFGAAAISAGADVLEMAKNVRQLRGEIQNVTDLVGPALDEATGRVLAISETFAADQAEVLEAANAVSSQLGISFEEALDKIETGFIAGSDQTGEFLDSLREYPAALNTIGVNADAVFKVINQSVTEGVYSDKGIDAIKEAGLALRELPQATRDAVEAIGLDSNEIQKLIAEEGVGAGIAAVSEQLATLEADSPEVGQALADIFKGAGEDAGLDFILTLKNLNDETSVAIDTANAYQVEQAKLLQVNKDFAAAQVEVAEALGGTGASQERLAAQIKTGALRILTTLIETLKVLFAATEPMRTAFGKLAEAAGLVSKDGSTMDKVLEAVGKTVGALEKPISFVADLIGGLVEGIANAINRGKEFLQFIGAIESEAERIDRLERERAQARANFQALTAESDEAFLARRKRLLREGAEANRRADAEAKAAAEAATEATKKYRKEITKTAVAADAAAKGSLNDLKAQIQAIQKDLDNGLITPDVALSGIAELEAGIERIEDKRRAARRALSEEFAVEAIDFNTPDIEFIQANQTEVEEARDKVFRKFNKARQEEAREFRANKFKEELEAEEQQAQQRIERELATFDAIQSLTTEVLNTLSSANEERTNRELSEVRNRYEREIELAEGNTERQEELRQELADEEQRIEREAFERTKSIQVAAAQVALANGLVNIASAPSTIPQPFDLPLRLARAALLVASTIKQIGAINSQTIAEQGYLADDILIGDRHSAPSGGIPLVLNGQRVLAEAGESIQHDEFGGLVVMNRNATLLNRGKLAGKGRIAYPGKRAELSRMNAATGGVRFAALGDRIEPPTVRAIAQTTANAAGTKGGRTLAPDYERIETSVANGAYRGALRGVEQGTADANQRAAREAQLEQDLNR